jgi:hypothetical protein
MNSRRKLLAGLVLASGVMVLAGTAPTPAFALPPGWYVQCWSGNEHCWIHPSPDASNVGGHPVAGPFQNHEGAVAWMNRNCEERDWHTQGGWVCPS